MPFPLSQLSTSFLHMMTMAMYREEARQYDNPNLLTNKEIEEFYTAYMGYPL